MSHSCKPKEVIMKFFVKQFLVLLAPLSLTIAPASAISSGGSTASLEGVNTSLIGPITVSKGLGQASVGAVQAYYGAIEASAKLGREMLITSAKIVGDVVHLTIEASSAAVHPSGDVIEFTLEVSKSAFEASLTGLEATFELMLKGVKVAIKSIPIIAGVGVASQVVGHSLVLAASTAVVVGVVLNELGKQLYAEEL